MSRIDARTGIGPASAEETRALDGVGIAPNSIDTEARPPSPHGSRVGSRNAWLNVATFVAAWLAALALAALVLEVRPGAPDAHAYWHVWHGDPYLNVLYPPPALLLFAPAAVLSESVFVALWLGLLVVVAAWLVWPLPLRLRIPLVIALAATAAWGNIAILLGAALVLTSRYPIAWAAIGWVKITPAIGALSLVRGRRWGDLAVVLVPSILVGAALVLLVPGLTAAWLVALYNGQKVADLFGSGYLPPFPVWMRLPFAAAVAWWGSSRPWTLVVAAAIATPDLSLATCGMLAAAVRLRR